MKNGKYEIVRPKKSHAQNISVDNSVSKASMHPDISTYSATPMTPNFACKTPLQPHSALSLHHTHARDQSLILAMVGTGGRESARDKSERALEFE